MGTQHKGLLVSQWFRKEARKLPWRETDNPYYILVSEVMLQQTQVKTVIPYYLRFIETLPQLEDLANASEDTLHDLWQGLGYYSRVHRLKQFAIRVLEEYDGVIPSTKEKLLKLPGIGPYTVGALLSFAFHIKEPAIDGNVNRVISRLYNDDGDITKVATKNRFHEYVLEFMDEDAYSFNQGMIELGALICTPKNPKCESCPLNKSCIAYAKDTVSSLPNKPKKKRQVLKKVPVFIIRENDEFLFVQRDTGGLLANMFGFPIMDEGVGKEEDDLINSFTSNDYKDFFEENLGSLVSKEFKYIGKTKHVFSHMIWEQYIYYAQVKGLKKALGQLESPVIKWSTSDEISIPTAFKKSLEVYNKYSESILASLDFRNGGF